MPIKVKLTSKFNTISRQFVLYVVIGILTQLIDLGSYSILVYLGVFYVIADILNIPLALGFNYLGHKYLTFDSKQWDKHEVGRYIVNFIINFIFATLILIFFTSIIGVGPIYGKIFTIVCIPLINFLLLKRFVFQK